MSIYLSNDLISWSFQRFDQNIGFDGRRPLYISGDQQCFKQYSKTLTRQNMKQSSDLPGILQQVLCENRVLFDVSDSM